MDLKQQSSRSSIDRIFKFLRDQINREDLIEPIWKRYQDLRRNPGAADTAYAGLFLELSSFIVSHAPIVVKRSYTKEELHEDIHRRGLADGLPDSVRMFLVTGDEARFLLFRMIVHPFVSDIRQLEGLTKLHALLEVAQIPGIDCTQKEDDCILCYDGHAALPTEKLVQLFSRIFSEYVSLYSEKKAAETVAALYAQLLAVQSPSLMEEFFSYIPEPYLSTERLAYISAEELKRRVADATKNETRKKEEAEALSKELAAKVAEVEAQNKLMQDTKRAMLNLLEDAKGLEEELKTERDQAQAILSSMGEGLVVLDRSHRIVLVNSAARQILGVSDETMRGAPWEQVVRVFRHDTELSFDEQPVGHVFHYGHPNFITMEDGISVMAGNGKKIPVALANSPLMENGSVNQVVVVFRDVTKEREEKSIIEQTVAMRTKELRQEQARLTASINSLSLGFIMTNVASDIVIMNRSVSNILGIAPSTASLADIDAILGAELSLSQRALECLAKRSPLEIKHIAFRARHLRVLFAPIFLAESGSDALGTVILFEDITEAYLLERSRDEFFSIASHELRTPLTAIRGNTSMIKDFYAEKISDPEFLSMVSDIHDSSVRLIDIVNDFLDVSRLELGKIDFKKEECDIASLIDATVKNLQPNAGEKQTTLVYDRSEVPAPHVVADSARVTQVLFNLLGNAIKFTANGTVTVKTSADGAMLTVTVEDTGRGIAPEQQPLLFRKFQQAGESLLTRDTTKGTGLGLYISKLMVEGMGGTIGIVRSSPDKGSVFSFTLPLWSGKTT